METSFKNDSSPESESNDAPSTTADAVVDEQEMLNLNDADEESNTDVARRTDTSVELGQGQGEIDQDDILTPYLSLVGGGELADVFNKGEWVYGSSLLIAGRGDPLNFVVLGYQKLYEEWIHPYVAGAQSKRWRKKQEVIDEGFTLKWDDPNTPAERKGRPMARPTAKFLVIIEKPEKLDSPRFSFEYDGKFYAPAYWWTRGSAYAGAKRIFSAEALDLVGKGLLKGMFTMHSEKIKSGEFQVWAPQVSLTSENTDEFVEFIKNNFG